jgi:hypothetical protein
MEGYGEHLYGIDKDDIMQHRDNASAAKIIGTHGTLTLSYSSQGSPALAVFRPHYLQLV